MTDAAVGRPPGSVPVPVPAAVVTVTPPAPEPPDPDAVAAAVRGCPDVVDLSAGAFGEAATYLPGRKVAGVQITPDGVEVHVVARYGPPLDQIAARIRRALGPVAPGLPVAIVFDDISLT